jgi:hypothetical protein
MKRLVFIAASLRALACVPVEGDHILAKHLAKANPVFAALDADLPIAFSPRPGITRRFRAQDQVQLAHRHGLDVTEALRDVCFVGAGDAPSARQQADREVERGQRVSVEVSSGATRLRFQAEAASAGRTGESVVVKNPENGHLFSAKVQGKGKVVIQR